MDKKYIVIGGQYMQRVYGLANTLQGAKRIASKNREYWDNWQGWHTPKIYALSDCYQEEGQWYHYLWAMPVSVCHLQGNRTVWRDYDA